MGLDIDIFTEKNERFYFRSADHFLICANALISEKNNNGFCVIENDKKDFIKKYEWNEYVCSCTGNLGKISEKDFKFIVKTTLKTKNKNYADEFCFNNDKKIKKNYIKQLKKVSKIKGYKIIKWC